MYGIDPRTFIMGFMLGCPENLCSRDQCSRSEQAFVMVISCYLENVLGFSCFIYLFFLLEGCFRFLELPLGITTIKIQNKSVRIK